MRWPRVCKGWRLGTCVVLSLLTLCIFYAYHTLQEISETTSTITVAPAPVKREITTSRSFLKVAHVSANLSGGVHASLGLAATHDECFPSEAELLDFPNCREKWAWMREGWKTNGCYKEMGVNGSGCSFRRFLSTAERHCPPLEGLEPMESEGEAEPNFSIEALFAKMVDKPVNFEFIKTRISRMWPSWKEAYRENLRMHRKSMEKRRRLRIIIHLGFLTNTKFGELSSKGGPLGELVQWSDLIAALHILGHDLRISTETKTVVSTIDAFSSPLTPCPNGSQLDLIFTDIMGLRAMQRKKRTFIATMKCKLRLLDSFGTQAEFNSRDYFAAHKEDLGKKNPWGGHGLVLRQFLSLYPHTPDNTFLGFVVNVNETRVNGAEGEGGGGEADAAAAVPTPPPPRSGALVYGKLQYMWNAQAQAAVRAVMEVTEVHATVADVVNATTTSSSSSLPAGVINHGLLGEEEFHRLLSKVRVFLGLGFPFEGPAPLEAVAHGAIFINPRFTPPKGRKTDKFFEEKPTLRALTSQCPYLEEIGEPWVITVDTNDTVALKEAIQRAMMSEVTPRLPHELTAAGMLLRVSRIVDRLDTCVGMPVYPPPRALRERRGEAGASCESTCAAAGLRCDSALFPLVNKREKLMRAEAEGGMGCQTVAIAPSIVAPSRCTLQENPLLFSCSSAMAGTVRLCPCRDFLPDQKELCSDCL